MKHLFMRALQSWQRGNSLAILQVVEFLNYRGVALNSCGYASHQNCTVLTGTRYKTQLKIL